MQVALNKYPILEESQNMQKFMLQSLTGSWQMIWDIIDIKNSSDLETFAV